jgi:hypothetical protein
MNSICLLGGILQNEKRMIRKGLLTLFVLAIIPSNMAYGLTGCSTSIGVLNGIRRIVIPPNRVIRLIARVTKISQ